MRGLSAYANVLPDTSEGCDAFYDPSGNADLDFAKVEACRAGVSLRRADKRVRGWQFGAFAALVGGFLLGRVL